uniref:Transthyretin n=1 Tax=Seriola dumerili TaxID=41447 RepID=A0A3B4V4N9_SERDU
EHHQLTMLHPLSCLLLASAVLLCYTAPTVSKHGGSDTKCPLMVKILDAVKGTPAGSVPLKVSQREADGGWTQIANGLTDAAGEIHNLITEEQFPAGVYRVEFDTKAYWKSEGSTPFHEVADVVFEAHAEGHRHYTLALLLSPYSYTTTAVVTDAHQ